MTRSLLLAVLLLAPALPVRAQQTRDLRAAVDRIAAAWSRGDARGLATRGCDAGIALETSEGPMGPLPPRQAAAVLRRVFEQAETVSARTAQVAVTGGDPQRAYGEIEWMVRPRGTTILERAHVFVALVREGDQWRVTQIRLMR